MLAMIVAGMTLVPLWQSVGHAGEIQYSVMGTAGADAHPAEDHFGAPTANHHAAVDHAHELPILRLASLLQAAPSSDRWSLPTPLNGDGIGPFDPEQPPRHI
jgi:hypothetical protein